MGGTVIYCLNARAEFTPEEKHNLKRYKLHKLPIYNSERSKQMLARADAHDDGSTRGALKGLAYSVMHRMALNITVDGLERGQYIECKSMDELLGAEEACIEACRNLKGYLDVAATFDGRMVVIDFDSGEPEIVAASGPAEQLVAPPAPPAPPQGLPSPEQVEEADFAPAPPAEPEFGPEAETERSEYEEPQPDPLQPVKDLWSRYQTDHPFRKNVHIGIAVLLFSFLLVRCAVG